MKTPKFKILLEKSVSSSVSAIEIYNKPNFIYREETFSILMINAWELLLKAKILFENKNRLSSIFVKEHKTLKNSKKSKKKYIVRNRSGNPMTIGINKALTVLENTHDVKLDMACKDNIYLLLEIRDNAIHYRNVDKHLNKKIQEIGTATLKNYLELIKDWFTYDLSKYNFYLMPLSFYHEFESFESFSVSHTRKESDALLQYISKKEKEYEPDPESAFNITLRLKTKFVKSTDTDALLVKHSTDPNALPITLTDEEIRKRYPWDYRELTKKLKKRYTNFKENMKYHNIRIRLKQDPRYCKTRYLDPENTKGLKKDFFNPEILKEFDIEYKK